MHIHEKKGVQAKVEDTKSSAPALGASGLLASIFVCASLFA